MRDRRVGFEHPEVEALLDVEPHDVGIVVQVPDGEVLPALDLEIAAAQAQHDTALDAGRPHQGPAEDLAQVVEHQFPAVLRASRRWWCTCPGRWPARRGRRCRPGAVR